MVIEIDAVEVILAFMPLLGRQQRFGLGMLTGRVITVSLRIRYWMRMQSRHIAIGRKGPKRKAGRRRL
jgi:hypothetical protein